MRRAEEGRGEEVTKTLDDPKAIKKGWGWPAAATRAHYFVDARSLCMKWLFNGELQDSNREWGEDCAECKRRCKKFYGGK